MPGRVQPCLGECFIDGAAHCCALSTARSRAATMTNLARASLALVLRAVFGGAKSCALVNLFMICPRWSVSSDHGQIMLTAISWHSCQIEMGCTHLKPGQVHACAN